MTTAMLIFSVLTVLSAVGVVAMEKPLNSALCLVATLFLVAVHFALLDAHFLAALQIVVYAGAIMVLVIFVIMLLGPDANLKSSSRSLGKYLVALVVGGFVSILWLVVDSKDIFVINSAALSPRPQGSTEALGELLFTKYLLPFEIASVMLLAAIIGAVLLAYETRRSLPPGRGLKAKREQV